MTMEPKVVRTLKKTFDDERFMGEAQRRKQVSDDILDIIYSKVVSGETDRSSVGRGVNALLDDSDDYL